MFGLVLFVMILCINGLPNVVCCSVVISGLGSQLRGPNFESSAILGLFPFMI